MILIDDMNIKPAQFYKVTIPTRTYSPTHIHHYAFEPVHQSLILLINVSCFTKKKNINVKVYGMIKPGSTNACVTFIVCVT